MTRYVGPKCRLCRREGVKLFLKGARCESPKCAITLRPSVPGPHGKRRIKATDYSLQLREKQKVKRIYGVPEAQFQNYYSQSRKSSLNTGEALLSMLERRLDNVVYRTGAAVSRAQARQKILHGEIKVGGRTASSAAYEVRPGDLVSFEKDILTERIVPDWIILDKKKKAATINSLPLRDQVKEGIREQLIIEFYSR